MIKCCVVCGREFEGHGNRIYCGAECRRKVINETQLRKWHERHGRKESICEICGKPIINARGNQSYHECCLLEDVRRTLRSGKKISPAQRNRLHMKGIPISEIRATL
jgi:hypothetical protein